MGSKQHAHFEHSQYSAAVVFFPENRYNADKTDKWRKKNGD